SPSLASVRSSKPPSPSVKPWLSHFPLVSLSLTVTYRAGSPRKRTLPRTGARSGLGNSRWPHPATAHSINATAYANRNCMDFFIGETSRFLKPKQRGREASSLDRPRGDQGLRKGDN